MSAPSADLSEARTEPRGATAATVVGIAVGLLLLSVAAAFLWFARGGPIDAAATLESAFGLREPPAGWRAVEAHEMPGGEQLVVLERADAEVEPEAPESTDDSPAEPDSPRFDWSKVQIGPAGASPRRLVLLLLPRDAPRSRIERYFEHVGWRDLADVPRSGGLVPVGSGKTAWRGFDARWIHERAFESGGSFRDAMKVDVSTAEQPAVITAFWTRGAAGSVTALEAVLAALGAR